MLITLSPDDTRTVSKHVYSYIGLYVLIVLMSYRICFFSVLNVWNMVIDISISIQTYIFLLVILLDIFVFQELRNCFFPIFPRNEMSVTDIMAYL